MIYFKFIFIWFKMNDIKNIINNKKVIICVGSGGVGKTTTSATIALHAAIEGKKALVVTIDPAKRLANSLGLKELTSKETEIDLTPLKKRFDITPKGKLFAMMLDMKSTMDEMVKRDLPKEKQENLLNNPVYQAFSTSLGGTHEFAAMEKLWEIEQKKEYDLIIVDTPPTVNALDFLAAPQRMINIFDNEITKIFIKLYSMSNKITFNIFNLGSQVILRGLSKFAGIETLDVIAFFLFNISEMLDGIKFRSKAVFELLQSNKVSFVIVTSPNPINVNESLYLKDKINELKLNLEGFVVNRFHFPFVSEERFNKLNIDNITQNLIKQDVVKNMEIHKVKEVVTQLHKNLEHFNKLYKIETKTIMQLENQSRFLIKIPFFRRDIYDLCGLLEIRKYLINDEKTYCPTFK